MLCIQAGAAAAERISQLEQEIPEIVKKGMDGVSCNGVQSCSVLSLFYFLHDRHNQLLLNHVKHHPPAGYDLLTLQKQPHLVLLSRAWYDKNLLRLENLMQLH